MIKAVLNNIDGVAIYPVLSLSFFGITFLCLVIWAMRLSPGYVNAMSKLPLENDDESMMNGERNHE